VRAGLTTSQTTQLQQLTELLNSLENVVENLNYKSFTVYDTLTIAIQGVRVALSDIATDETGTDII
jgi:translation initiation factor 2B subunit (eIF-2B alpha/beta/delta family)